MKKWIAAILPLLLVLCSAPSAVASTSSAAVIDMRGAKTYIGTVSDWGKTWNEDNFTEVTGDDVSYEGNLTVKSGSVGDITLNGSSSKLTVQGGTMDDISCSGSAEIKDGDMKSVDTGGDLKISGGNIRHDVNCGGGATLSSTVKIGGDLKADEIIASSGAKVNVTGIMKAESSFTLNSCTLKTKGIDGDDTGTLTVNQYTATLPTLSNLKRIDVKSSTTATANEKIEAEELYIESDAQFSTSSTLELDTLTGPGTLYFPSGKLTVNDSIGGKPLLVFSNSVGKGDTAFYGGDSIDEDDVRLYDFGLEKKDGSGSEDKFVLTNALTDGITLSSRTLSLNSGGSATVTAHVKPDFSKFATGTKIVWEIYGGTTAFSKSVASGGLSCTVSVPSSVKGMYKGTLIVYLADSHGDRLEDYKSDSCVLSTGYSENTGNPSDGSLSLDTSEVSILTGDRYWVLARTSSAAAPAAISYNSAVATVGAGTAVKDSSGNPAWLYPVTGTGKGMVTIEIGGQKMIASVSSGITIDTSTYTMAPGGSYIIGVTARGITDNSIWASSNSSCVAVQFVKKSGNMLLYRISGQSAGTASVTFSITGGGSVGTAFTVQNGVKAGGTSSRLVALA